MTTQQLKTAFSEFLAGVMLLALFATIGVLLVVISELGT